MSPTRFVAGAAVLVTGSAASGAVELETFNGAAFTNPFFQHDIEFDNPCCWEFVFRNEVDLVQDE